MHPLSLSTKMSWAVSLLVGGMLSLLALSAHNYFENQFKETISRQQFTMVSALAEQIDDKILSAHEQLIIIAKAMSPELIRDRDGAQRFLESRLISRKVFDGGIFLLSPSGTMYAGTSMEPHMRGKDYSYRGYFKKTVATGKPQISEPLSTTQKSGHPTIVFTAPIFDDDGRLAAVLIGALDLMKDNFLGKLAKVRIAQTGYIYLFDTLRTVIIHPDRSRILKRDVPPGANKLFDRAIEGFDGTGATVNSRGLHALSTFKHLKSTNWILAANYPEAEAYAPIYRAQRYFLMALVPALVVTVLMVWLFMRRLTAPLRTFTGHVRNIATDEGPHTPISIATRDEIGVLAETFNRMMARREELEARLRHAQKMEAVGTLAGGIAHDFSTILTAIKGYGTILRMETDRNTPAADRYLAEIEAAVDRGAALTRGLLTYSRKETCNPVRADLNMIVREMTLFVGNLLGDRIELTTLLAEHELPVLADVKQIEQILMNLATNARDAMESGGRLMIRTGRAEIDDDFARSHGLRRAGAYAILSLADTGEGMDPETMERIFEPFFSTKGVGRGTGLGLSIVYGIVQQHKGCITVNSCIGSGTEFCIYLPFVED